MGSSRTKFPGSGTEIIPVKDPHTGIGFLFSYPYCFKVLRFTNFPGAAGQMPYSHLSAWGVGGLVPFMINLTHLRLRIKPLALATAVT